MSEPTKKPPMNPYAWNPATQLMGREPNESPTLVSSSIQREGGLHQHGLTTTAVSGPFGGSPITKIHQPGMGVPVNVGGAGMGRPVALATQLPTTPFTRSVDSLQAKIAAQPNPQAPMPMNPTYSSFELHDLASAGKHIPSMSTNAMPLQVSHLAPSNITSNDVVSSLPPMPLYTNPFAVASAAKDPLTNGGASFTDLSDVAPTPFTSHPPKSFVHAPTMESTSPFLRSTASFAGNTGNNIDVSTDATPDVFQVYRNDQVPLSFQSHVYYDDPFYATSSSTAAASTSSLPTLGTHAFESVSNPKSAQESAATPAAAPFHLDYPAQFNTAHHPVPVGHHEPNPFVIPTYTPVLTPASISSSSSSTSTSTSLTSSSTLFTPAMTTLEAKTQNQPPSPIRSPPKSPRRYNLEERLRHFLASSPPPPPPIPTGKETLQLEDIPDTMDGLITLAQHRQWSHVIAKVQLVLVKIPFDDMERTLKIQSIQLLALMKRHQYEDVGEQLVAMGDLDDKKRYSYEAYPKMYTDRSGSMMPFLIRIIHALYPSFMNDLKQTQERLTRLWGQMNDALETNSPVLLNQTMPCFSNATSKDELESHRDVIEQLLINSFIATTQYSIALRYYTARYQRMGMQALPEEKMILGFRIGRLYLQMGNLKLAKQMFQAVEDLLESPESNPHVLLHRGLLYFALDSYSEAIESFLKVLNMYPASPSCKTTIMSTSNSLIDQVVDQKETNVLCSAANNLAICYLYSCDVQKAVDCLENVIQRDPRNHLNDELVFNLCTLYDLACDNETSQVNKKVLQAIMKKYGVEELDRSSFRL